MRKVILEILFASLIAYMIVTIIFFGGVNDPTFLGIAIVAVACSFFFSRRQARAAWAARRREFIGKVTAVILRNSICPDVVINVLDGDGKNWVVCGQRSSSRMQVVVVGDQVKVVHYLPANESRVIAGGDFLEVLEWETLPVLGRVDWTQV